MPGARVRIHQGFGKGEVLRVSAFDRVRGQRERRSAESDERHAMGTIELAPNHSNGFEDVRERLPRFETSKPIDIGFGTQRILNRRSFATDEVERDSHRLERQQQIRKQNGRIDVDAAHRLHRNPRGKLGRSADVQKRMVAANFPVLGHVAPGLPHEPDGGAIDRLAPARFEKPIVHARDRTTSRFGSGGSGAAARSDGAGTTTVRMARARRLCGWAVGSTTAVQMDCAFVVLTFRPACALSTNFVRGRANPRARAA